MKYLMLVFWLAIWSNCLAQNSCATATVFVDNQCYWSGSANATLCFSFISPEDSIDFTFTSFAEVNTCTDVISSYTLYDDLCNAIETNSDGSFENLVPNNEYAVCYTVSCPTTGFITLICTSELIILPVELIEFTGRLEKDCIELRWSTATETNCGGFTLRKSSDLVNWINTGSLEGNGTTQEVHRYSWQDSNPFKGVNYYQLLQWDLDGDQEVLGTIALFYSRELGVSQMREYNFLGQKVK